MFQYYRFLNVADVPAAVQWFQEAAADLKGTALIAPEGINLSFAGEDAAIERFMRRVHDDDCPCPPDPRGVSRSFPVEFMPYRRLRIRERREIITFKQDVDTSLNEGHFLTPAEFHERMQRGEVIPVDTRNLYESKIGTFRGAVLWPIDTFSELPDHLDVVEPLREKEIVTFCTGGVRCEKVVPFLRSKGFTKVWQIKGGIQDYFDQYPDGFWEGECFVFDDRYSIRPDGSQGTARPCARCRQPVYNGACVSCGHTEVTSDYTPAACGLEPEEMG
jgi:UPF0176 protein